MNTNAKDVISLCGLGLLALEFYRGPAHVEILKSAQNAAMIWQATKSLRGFVRANAGGGSFDAEADVLAQAFLDGLAKRLSPENA